MTPVSGGTSQALSSTTLALAGVWLLLATGASGAQELPTVSVGAVDYNPISVIDVDEISHKWWFWVIIGVLSAFLIVLGFFGWRGYKQWRKHKQAVVVCQEKEKEGQEGADGKAASPGGHRHVTAVPLSADSAAGAGAADVEMGRVFPTRLPAPGEPMSEGEAEMVRERERRTAVHPKRPKL